MSAKSAVIDDLSREPPNSAIGTRWQLFTDRVMGGVSNGTMVRETVAGRPAIRMRGDVSLENNGGFVQIAIDLAPDGKAVDASPWQGVEFDVLGNGEEYGIHLRTEDLTRPWQSYRQSFRADPQWRTITFRFQDFVPYRTEARSMPVGYDALAWLRSAARFRLILRSADCAIWPDAPNS